MPVLAIKYPQIEIQPKVSVEVKSVGGSYTVVLNHQGAGALLAVEVTDLDGLAQDEHIVVNIDDKDIVTTGDMQITNKYLNLHSLMIGCVTAGASFKDEPPQVYIPFSKQLIVKAYRDTAGTLGLKIEVIYAKEVR
jgi:hypothetical protein